MAVQDEFLGLLGMLQDPAAYKDKLAVIAKQQQDAATVLSAAQKAQEEARLRSVDLDNREAQLSKDVAANNDRTTKLDDREREMKKVQDGQTSYKMTLDQKDKDLVNENSILINRARALTVREANVSAREDKVEQSEALQHNIFADFANLIGKYSK